MDKNLHSLYTRLSLDLMRYLVNRWSPLTHASHCMTTSRPAAATEMRVRVSLAMQPKVFLHRMLFLPQPTLFLGLRTASLHTPRLAVNHEAKLYLLFNYVEIISYQLFSF